MAWSLYNKYRPSTFSEVVGQEHVEKTLMNAVATNTVSHAYLFAGPRGTGKTTTARLLAKALLCELAPTDQPDGSCLHCREIAAGIHPDVYELDAASRTGVDNVREEIIGRVNFAPTHGKWKIYIIDEVHMLTNQAFNALLKTLEEPPAQVLFVLCTTDAHKVPATIQSRCQRFDFHRLAVEQIAVQLAHICQQEGFSAEPRALEMLAQRSQGGMRDAISSLEQVAVYSGGQITFAAAESMIGETTDDQLFALAETLAAGDAAGSFSWIADFVIGGTDIALLASDLARHVRNLYLTALTQDNDRLLEILAVQPDKLTQYQAQARDFGSPERLAYTLTVLGNLTSELKSAPNARLALEIACTRIIHPQDSQGFEALAARVANIERALASGAVAVPRSDEQVRYALVAEEPSAALASAVADAATTAAAVGAPTAASASASGVVAPTDASVSVATAPAPAAATAASTPTAPSPEPTTTAPQAVQPTPPTPQTSEPTRGCHDIGSIWHHVVEELKKESRSLATRLSGSQARLENEGVVVQLPAGADFARKTLETPESLAMVRAMITKLSGAERELRYVVANEPVIEPRPQPQPAMQSQPQPQQQAHPQPAPSAAPEEPASTGEPDIGDIAAMLAASLGTSVTLEEIHDLGGTD